MTTATVVVHGVCPVHGLQPFIRVGELRWWECPLAGMFEPGSCGSVIPDELVTPDGAEVAHVSDARFEGSRRRWGSA